MSAPPSLPTTRLVYRQPISTNPDLKLSREPLPFPVLASSLLLRNHHISLNYRDANILHNSNPWPVLPNLIPCSDCAAEVISIGSAVKSFSVGDRVSVIVDQASITGREQERKWLACDADGVLGDYAVVEEGMVVRLPEWMGWEEGSLLPCAGVTAWSALKGLRVGATVLVQGTGGVSMMAVKLARAMGCKVILSSSDDGKLERLRERYAVPPLLTVNYKTIEKWDEEVVRLTNGAGVDLVIENGGTSSLIRSLKATKRDGVISQVGYLGKQDPQELAELVPLLIDRKINLRGINVGSKHDFEDLVAAIEATHLGFDDVIDKVFDFEQAEEAIEYVWAGRQVGKVVIRIGHAAEP